MFIRFHKSLALTAVAMLAFINVFSEHITGGELTVRQLGPNLFEGTLSLYRDCASGGAPFDPTVRLTVFDALTNEILLDPTGTADIPEAWIVFSQTGDFEILTPELGNSCFTPDVCLEIGVYRTQFELPDNPNGYYLAKERCCRNTESLNIPQVNEIGFVFTADIPDPAVFNSTPVFGEYPAEAFLCVNGPNLIDFGATDADGDSLVYSFTEAIRGSSTNFAPDPQIASPKPWAVVPWEMGYSTDNQVGGTNPMTINSETGLITAQPDLQGVFTVAVRVDEYRDGILIGTIRRELQLSSTPCEFDFPSVITTPDDILEFDFLVGLDSCITITVTDPNEGDSLFVSASGPLFDGTVEPMAFFTDSAGESIVVQDFCWKPSCENLNNGPFPVTFTAFSTGCAAEPFITELTIFIDPYIDEDEETSIIGPFPGDTVEVNLYDIGSHCFDFEFLDPNTADTLIVNLVNSELENQDVQPEIDQGQVVFPVCWNVECEDVRPEDPYFIDFTVTARNCEVDETVEFSVPIIVFVPDDIESQFSLQTDESIVITAPDTVRWVLYSSDSLSIPITFSDANPFDTLTFFTPISEIFSAQVPPAQFDIDTIRGLGLLSANIHWQPTCDQVREEPYLINFTGQAESCETSAASEFTVVLFLDLPPESPPSIATPMPGFSVEHSIGEQPIEFDVLASDVDPYDTLTLSISASIEASSGRIPVFEGILSGTGSVLGDFFWAPDCPDVEPEPYIFNFIVNSSSCQKSVNRSIEVPIFVTTPTLGVIEPIQNIFTPNGDGRNEVWTIENKEDPCLLNFNSVVYDRWGKEVFQSNDPAFMWNGDYANGNEASPGQYFQIIEYFYKDRGYSYNGSITLGR